MHKCRLLSYLPSRINRSTNKTTLQSFRSTTTVSADYTDADLAAAKPYEEIPSLMCLPIVGTGWAHLPVIGRYKPEKLIDGLMDKRRLLGDIYKEKFGNFNMIVSFNADDLQVIFKHEGDYPQRTEVESLKRYREYRKQWFTSMGIGIMNGKEWHDLRKKVQKHLMKPRAIQAFLEPMQDVARDLVQKMHLVRDANKEVPDFLNELYKWSLESIALVGLDTRLGCLERNLSPDSDGLHMINNVQTMFETANKLEAFSGKMQVWKYFSTPTWKRFVKANDVFTEIAFKHINRSLEKLKNVSEDQDLTLLQSLLLEKGMDLSAAMVLVSDMLMAGIDTTSNTIGFFLYHMAKNPDKQEYLYEDLKRIFPNKEDRITPAIFNELRYLKACIKESQRMNPVIGIHVRTTDHDVVLSGYRAPAGTALMTCLQALYMDERYFSKPDTFLPERWLQKDEKFHPFAFVPFGFGVRSCVGRRLAELEIISLATELIRNFRVEYHHEDVGIVTRFVNVPDKPLRFKFIER